MDPVIGQSARDAVNAEFELRGPRAFGQLWHVTGDPSSAMLCGTFEPDAISEPFVDEHRFIYTVDDGHALIAPVPELMISGSTMTQGIIAATVAQFDRAWVDGCEDHRPTAFSGLLR